MESERDRLREDLRVWGRRALRSVWRRSGRGENLSEEERCLAAILDEHPEFEPVWEAGEAGEAIDPGGGEINPYLHIEIHMMVESQITSVRPPEVAETLERLLNGGVTRHEAIHAIGKVLTLEMHRAIQTRKPFDGQSYVRSLERLAP